MNKSCIPCFAEYRAEVKKHFQTVWPQLSNEDVETYLNSDEAKEKIERDYLFFVELRKAENIGEETPPIGTQGSTPAAVGFCLGMMY